VAQLQTPILEGATVTLTLEVPESRDWRQPGVLSCATGNTRKGTLFLISKVSSGEIQED
jgi:hypothetical protein